MKPLILGMGPSRSHPTEAWHAEARSTANLCQLITGTTTHWPIVKRNFEVMDLNKHWHWVEGTGDSVHPQEAEMMMKTLISNKLLRGGRKAFLLGEQVTNFVCGFLRGTNSALAEDAWRKLPKCVGHRLRTDDTDARIGAAAGYYDFVAIPVWHPRILLDPEIRMPPGWRQRMMNAMRAASGLPPIKFKQPQHPGQDNE